MARRAGRVSLIYELAYSLCVHACVHVRVRVRVRVCKHMSTACLM